jgi:hypothetical protein
VSYASGLRFTQPSAYLPYLPSTHEDDAAEV